MAKRPRMGRCELFDEIARGGMATIHLGRWVGSGGFRKLVAVKRLHSQLSHDPEFVAMFLDEARVVARIQHPNVVPIVDLVERDGELAIVMDYVAGVTLGHLVAQLSARGERVPSAVVKRLMCDALDGLHAAHEARDEDGERLRVIHRDVSPGNILVGIDGHARVLDFGVARAAGRLTQTQTGVIKGKLVYLAPEQLREGRLSRRTDVYGASVVMWQALTGLRLFEGASPGQITMAILESRVPRPSELTAGVDEALDAIVMRGLQRAPELRWCSARHMAEAIEATGGLACHRVVGEWVMAIGAVELARRARMVRAVERVRVELPLPRPPRGTPRRVRPTPRARLNPRVSLSLRPTSSSWLPTRRVQPLGRVPSPLLRPPTTPPKRGRVWLQAAFVAVVAAALTIAALLAVRVV
ncbi:MAG: serine/threonine-protein kinase [Polyangiaceae bacterium]